MFLLVSLGEGFGVGFRWVVGVLWKMREKGKELGRVGGGVGTGKGTGKSMRTYLPKLPCSKLPFSFSLNSSRLRNSLILKCAY